MTKEELKLFEKTGDLFIEYKKLPELHPDDLIDFKFHIHALQNIILSRQAFAEYKLANPKPVNIPKDIPDNHGFF